MDGLGRVAGAPVSVRLGARTYLLEPMTLRRWGIVEQHLLAGADGYLARTLRALAALVKHPDLHNAFLQKVRDEVTSREGKALRIVPLEALRNWTDTVRGLAFTCWLCLERYPQFANLEAVSAAVRRMSPDARADLIERRDVASGTDLLSTWDWPDAVDPFASMRKMGKPSLKYMPWRLIYHKLREENGWGPDVVGGLTLYQVKLYTAGPEQIGGVGQITAAEAKKTEQGKRDLTRHQQRRADRLL